jgi:hypothetical protein
MPQTQERRAKTPGIRAADGHVAEDDADGAEENEGQQI